MTVTALHPARIDAGPHNLTRYKNGPDQNGTPGRGCRCPTCTGANRAYLANRDRLIAYGQWNGFADATGTQRRLQALMRNGWSIAALAAQLGCTKQVLRKKLHARYGRVYADTAAEVRTLYDALWDQAPPDTTRWHQAAATKARRYAAERGWPPPLAWDDDTIDDPDASPADGWEPREGVRRRGVLGEDSAFLLAAGEEPWRVAERLGVSQKTLRKVLAREREREEAADAA